MPSEPDKPIEQLLKKYAEKRRQDAGAPVEMHPATRRLLQGEVARQRRTAGAGNGSFLKLLLGSWPRFAFAGSAVALLTLIIWLSVPKSEPTRQLARAEKRGEPAERFLKKDMAEKDGLVQQKEETETRALKPTLQRQPASQPGGPQSDRSRVASDTYSFGLDSAKTTDALPGQAPANGTPGLTANAPVARERLLSEDKLALNAPKPVEAPKGSVTVERAYGLRLAGEKTSGAPAGNSRLALSAEKENLSLNVGRAAGEKKMDAPASTASAAPAPPAVSKQAEQLGRAVDGDQKLPSANPPVQLSAGVQAGKAVEVGAFAESQAQLGGQISPLTRDDASSSSNRAHFSQITQMPKVRAEANKEAALLDSFEMEQAGNRIRIYDRDGSVYEGDVQASAATPPLQSPTSNVLEKNKAQVTKESPVDRKAEALSDAELGQQKQSFRASGTNRSLNQLVVINGRFFRQL